MDWLSEIELCKLNADHAHRFIVRIPLKVKTIVESPPENERCTMDMLAIAGDVKRDNLEQMIFYGNLWSTGKRVGFEGDRFDEFAGFASHYDTLDPKRAQCSVNVFDGGSKTDRRTSIWLVEWRENTIKLATQDGTINGSPAALVVQDWRYVSRLANFDPYELRDPSDLRAYLSAMIYMIPNIIPKPMRARFYCSEAARSALRNCDCWPAVRGIPFRVVEALHEKEALVR